MTAEAARRPWLALRATLGTQMLASLVLSAPAVLAPAVAPELGLAPERVGLFIGVAYGVAMVSGLTSGRWVARFGGTRVTQAVLAFMAAGAMLVSVGQPAVLLLLAAALMGVGYGTVNPAAADILGRHAPPGSPGLFFAMKQAGVPAGVALAGLLMPVGLVALGWRPTAWLLAAACLLALALLVPAAGRLDDRPLAAVSPMGSGVATLLTVLRRPVLRNLGLVSLAYAMAQQGFVTFIVAFLYLELQQPLALAAGLLAASQGVCLVVRIGLGHVADRWVSPRLLLGGLGLCMAASCLALALLPPGVGLPLATLAVVAAGASTMGWNGVYFAQLLRSVERSELAASAGGTQFFTFAGSMLGPFLFGWVLHLGGSHATGYLGVAASAAIAGVLMLRGAGTALTQPQQA